MATQSSVFLIGDQNFGSFNPVSFSRTPKNIRNRNFRFFSSSVNPNSLFFIHRRVLPSIRTSASDSSQNSDRIDLTAGGFSSSRESDTVGFAGGDLDGGDAAATSVVEKRSEGKYAMGAPSCHELHVTVVLLVLLLVNNLLGLVILWSKDQEEKKSTQDKGKITESKVDRISESDELDERMQKIRAMSIEVRRREEMNGSDEINKNEQLTMDDESIPSVKDYEKRNGGDGDCLKMESSLFTKEMKNPTMAVHQRFNMWGAQTGRHGVWSSRLKYSVDDDIFDGMRTKRNAKESTSDEDDDQKLTLDDMWWRTLPYVNAIYIDMGTGEDTLFTFKMLDRKTAYLVTFEDHTDATNFCYTCHTSFSDPDKFRAGTIPLTLKDLLELTEIDKLIVVRKGQFKFYVGQPFPEIEMALRSLITRSSSCGYRLFFFYVILIW